MHRIAGAALLLAACSDPASSPDFGAPSDVYPATAIDAPAIEKAGHGGVMASVRVVPIFFAGDPLQTDLVTFLESYAASPVWGQQVGEYGVGALSAATAVVLPDAAPATTDSDQLEAQLAGLLDGTHPEMGPVDAATLATTVYVVHFPETTDFTLTMGGLSACTDMIGYHLGISSGATYAAVFECSSANGFTTPTDVATVSLSHELLEAATDPPPFETFAAPNPAAVGFAVAGSGGELADMCLRAGAATPTGFAHPMSRMWSNAQAAAFLDPCLPALDDQPYFAAIPEQLDTASVIVGAEGYDGAATGLALGESATVTVDLLSSGPTEDWTVDAFPLFPGDDSVALVLDRTTGRNGNRVHLTVTLTSSPALVTTTYVLRSTLGGRTFDWYGTIAEQ